MQTVAAGSVARYGRAEPLEIAQNELRLRRHAWVQQEAPCPRGTCSVPARPGHMKSPPPTEPRTVLQLQHLTVARFEASGNSHPSSHACFRALHWTAVSIPSTMYKNSRRQLEKRDAMHTIVYLRRSLLKQPGWVVVLLGGKVLANWLRSLYGHYYERGEPNRQSARPDRSVFIASCAEA